MMDDGGYGSLLSAVVRSCACRLSDAEYPMPSTGPSIRRYFDVSTNPCLKHIRIDAPAPFIPGTPLALHPIRWSHRYPPSGLLLYDASHSHCAELSWLRDDEF